MKFGLLTYDERPSGKFNVGDYIQSLAAKQYLPRVDQLIQRDYLNVLDLKEKTSVIMNGWYTHRPENWPPVDLLNPLFVSFHLNSAYADKILSKSENIRYLKQYGPIGCRDNGTAQYLTKYGISAYYSSCLTTTLDLKYKSEKRGDNIYIVDLLYKDNLKQLYKESTKRMLIDIFKGRYSKRHERDKTIASLIPKEILTKAKYLTHSYFDKDYNEREKFQLAENLLYKYSKAKLVITSRIHCALPCLALGTPVIFVTGGHLFKPNEMARLKGTIEHLNILTTKKINLDNTITEKINILNEKEIDWENIKNPTSYLPYSQKLKEVCFDFINKVTKE